MVLDKLHGFCKQVVTPLIAVLAAIGCIAQLCRVGRSGCGLRRGCPGSTVR
jgi:hypothetical protein